MKSIVLILLFLMFNAGISLAQNKMINFETASLAEIKAKAKKEKKLIFIDAYTNWCGPCRWMKKNVFSNDTVADYFNKKFINTQIDMEKGEGKELANLYSISCYPNLLFIDGDGHLIHRSAGAQPVREFIQFAEDAQNSQKKFSHYTDQYALKKNDPQFLSQYLAIISKTCLPYDKILSDYFKTQKDEDLTNRANWNTINTYCTNYNNREFKYLLNNVNAYKKAYTWDSVNTKIKNVFLNKGYDVIYKKGTSEADYNSYKNEISKIKFSSLYDVLFKLDLVYSQKNNNWAKYAALVVANGDTHLHSAHEFNAVSWVIYHHSNDKAALLKAQYWMQNIIQNQMKEQDWHMYHTYAAVLYKLKKNKLAKAAAEKAIETARASSVKEDDYKSAEKLLFKIAKLK